MAQRIPEPTITFSCSPRGWICSPGQSLPPASALVPVMSCFLRFSLQLLFNSSKPTDGTKKLHSVSFPGTEAPVDLKTYSLFPILSLNVPFVLQKEFQAHLLSVELGVFFANVPCSTSALLQRLRNAFVWDVGCGIPARSLPFLVLADWHPAGHASALLSSGLAAAWTPL